MKDLASAKFKISKNDVFVLLAMVALCRYTLFDYVRVAIGLLLHTSLPSNYFFAILYFVLIALSYSRSRIRWIRPLDIMIVLFFSIAILITILVYPVNEQYIADRLEISILPCLPFFLLGLCLTLDEKTISELCICCCLAIVVSILYILYFFSAGRVLTGDEMQSSYNLLPNVMIVLGCAFRYKRKYLWFFSLLGALYIIAMGTRGPMIILFCYYAVCLWRKAKNGRQFKVFIAILISGLFLLLMESRVYINILQFLKKIFDDFGLSTRLFNYLIAGSLIQDTSGRDKIYITLLDKLYERPLLGYGVYGEWQFIKYSAHNIYLETVFQYGLPIGMVLILSYLGVISKAFHDSVDVISKEWILIWACFTLIRGFFGGELLSWYVFLLLGFCLKEIRVAAFRFDEQKELKR